jgi:hypothetical protein
VRSAASQVGLPAVLGVLLFFVGIGLAAYFLVTQSSDAFRNVEKLDAISYAESAKSFQGGVYLVEGTLEELLDSSSASGRLVSLAVSSSRGVILIPVLVPQNLGSFNLQKGQGLKMKTKGIDRGLLQAEKIEKMM